jgi:hypothetical protein
VSLSLFLVEVTAQLAAINACTTLKVGDEYVEENGVPPRMVAIPSDDDFEATIGPGGIARSIRTRNAGAEVVLWGATREDVEGMISQFVVALHRACKSTTSKARGASYVLGSGRWTRKTNLTRHGFEYRLSFTVQIPIVERVWESVETPPATPGETYPAVPGDTGAAINVAAKFGLPSADPGVVDGNVVIVVPAP